MQIVRCFFYNNSISIFPKPTIWIFLFAKSDKNENKKIYIAKSEISGITVNIRQKQKYDFA
jgi:hypothetical protein